MWVRVNSIGKLNKRSEIQSSSTQKTNWYFGKLSLKIKEEAILAYKSKMLLLYCFGQVDTIELVYYFKTCGKIPKIWFFLFIYFHFKP